MTVRMAAPSRAGFVLLSALAGAGAHAAERGAWSAVQPDPIRAHVEFLASDLLEGRAAASRGYDVAAAYVAAQFRALQLASGGDEDSYLQSVPLLEATPVLPGSSAQLVRENETITFEYGTHYLPLADFHSASSTLTAPMVFAGFGVSAPDLGYDDLAQIDLKGRIAVVLSGAPAAFTHEQRAFHSWTHRKWTTLIERGAVGVITVNSLADEQRRPWERSVSMSWTPQMRWLKDDGEPQDAYPELKVRFQFDQGAAARLFEGAPSTLDQALASADISEPQAFELPGMLTLSATTGLRKTQSENVVGVLRGSDPQLRDEYVMVTAHLDHLGRGAAVEGDAIYNGAHDNAVGVGVLLEMARALRGTNARPRRSIVFAAVTAEEKGLLGADYLAEQWRAQGRRIVANINIDMPMIFAPVQDFVALGADHSSLGAHARSAAAAEGYRLSPDREPEEVNFIRSDQFAFIRRGVPAILLMGGDHPRDRTLDLSAMKQQFLRSDYHQPSDEPDLPFDYSVTADLARINLRIALDAANGARPRWNRGDFFATQFAGEGVAQ